MAEPPPPPPPILGDGVEIIDAQVQVASTDYRDMANNQQQQQNNTNANTNGHQQQEPMIGPQPPPEGMQQQQQDMENMPDQHILQLWNDVAQNLREHQTVVWTKAVDSLEQARDYLRDHPAPPQILDPSHQSTGQPPPSILTTLPPLHTMPNPGRSFIDRYMIQIISILLEQLPSKIGDGEKSCVDKSIRICLQIVKEDLDIINKIDKKKINDLKDKVDPFPPNNSSFVRNMIEACPTINALGHIFDRKKVYYKENDRHRWTNAGTGDPEKRSQWIQVFRRNRGFNALIQFMNLRAGSVVIDGDGDNLLDDIFPNIKLCRDLLGAIIETLPKQVNNDPGESDMQSAKAQYIISEVRALSKVIMEHVLNLDERVLKKLDQTIVAGVRGQLHYMYKKLNKLESSATPQNPTSETPLNDFFTFWRALALKLITSQSLPLKLFGWNEIDALIKEAKSLAPPPRAYRVSGAGTAFVNGIYEIDKKRIGSDGYVKDTELQYHHKVPDNNSSASTNGGVVPADAAGQQQPAVVPPDNVPDDGAGKTITLFRCTMRSQHKWWFLSEADPDQPGTDKDIDYYQLKTTSTTCALPSPTGWLTCKAGSDPPPTLEAIGKVVPKGMERQTVEDKLARWAIENGVIELVLGDGIHREVVSRSGRLITFLAKMSDQPIVVDEGDAMSDGDDDRYFLQASHLLLAWKTCINKSDAAVSAQIYKLLVSVLPELPSSLAIPLIEAIRSSLDQGGGEKQSDHFYEVSEFCCAIAKKLLADNNKSGSKQEATSVDEAILTLQWSILTHKDALALKSYDSIKDYVFSQISKQDKTTSKLREAFINQTREVIIKYGRKRKDTDPPVDEAHSLQIVQLAKLLLEGCSGKEMESILEYDGTYPDMHFPTLFFDDLVSYLERRNKAVVSSATPPVRKQSSVVVTPEFNHPRALTARLQILRFVFGLGFGPVNGNPSMPQMEMSKDQINDIWDVCLQPADQSAYMVFLATASKGDDCSLNKRNDGTGGEFRPENAMHNISELFPCFSDNEYIFENIFCDSPASPRKRRHDELNEYEDDEEHSGYRDSNPPGWETLGVIAYEAFQNFDAMSARNSPLTTDALWNICLTAGNDVVATRAMNDLLSVYKSGSLAAPESTSTEGILTNEDTQFSSRIFDYLTQVNAGLSTGSDSSSSERSAERCIRILSAAIEQCSSLGGGSDAVVERLSALQKQPSQHGVQVEEYLNVVPHGMRGQYSCHTVSVLAKATRGGGSNAAGDNTEGAKNKDPNRFTIQVHPLQTIASIKSQIATYCNHDDTMIKLQSIMGKRLPKKSGDASANLEPRVSSLPDTTLASTLRMTDGSELVVLLADKPIAPAIGPVDLTKDTEETKKDEPAINIAALAAAAEKVETPSKVTSKLDLTGLFSSSGSDGSSDLFFDTLISVLETLPVKAAASPTGADEAKDTHSLVWDLLLAMPTNAGIISHVHAACSTAAASSSSSDNMAVETISGGTTADWSSLLDISHYERSVYIMQILDSFLRPCATMFSSLSSNEAEPSSVASTDIVSADIVIIELSANMEQMAKHFRTVFIASGGFEAVLRLFIASGTGSDASRKAGRNKMGNTCALRIIKECFFTSDNTLSNEGREMIGGFDEVSMSNFLRSLVGIVTNEDNLYSDNAILRVLQLARMLLESGAAASGGAGITTSFTSLPNHAAETFLKSLLLWNGCSTSSSVSSSTPSLTSVRSATNIRKSTEEMILAIPSLSTVALPWLITSLKNIDSGTDGSDEFFSVLLKLVKTDNTIKNVEQLLEELGNVVCAKIASYPRPSGENAHIDHNTGVLCGCLRLLIALIEVQGGGDTSSSRGFLVEGSTHILQALKISPWSEETGQGQDGMMNINDKPLIDLIGSIFDGFVSSAHSSGLAPICCDAESRKLAFDVIIAAAEACSGGVGYNILSSKINGILSKVAPTLRHKWGQAASIDDGNTSSRNSKATSSRYSGLKNQGCTCYMNSVLQQLFMMPALRKNICSAELPSAIRTCGNCGTSAKTGGKALVGKKITVHWENGSKYDATVVRYNEVTGMHVINYCPIPVAAAVQGQQQQQQEQPFDHSSLPPDLPEEYILSEGRPGKETGAFDIVCTDPQQEGAASESKEQESPSSSSEIKETPDESSSRKLLEEVQRTFVNLDEGARGRCFDPRALVEASHCLKLEFDVWQQNDASEFAMKLLDRLEISLKKWSLEHFRYLAHTFGMKKTTQKICKECGLKTNREEPLMNIDCQIRNMSSIHDSLSDVCVDQIMEGDNKVSCENCKVKTNTILRTAISTLPDMLVLSLKRFDLDFTTFETVKLNSRCEFGEELNMKQYTLQAKEVLEAAGEASASAAKKNKEEEESKSEAGSMMDLEESDTKDAAEEEDPLSALPDEDYEYKLAGVLVHAGVAQGGHYYSFIKDRTSAKWYRFDDEDVTPFDKSSIERECFGGTVKKETKYTNGQTHVVEQDQFANALMLFYEKVKPNKFASSEGEEKEASASSSTDDAPMEEEPKPEAIPSNLDLTNGYNVFLPEVTKSNSTHSWQSFLLTNEFQSFVKEILNRCTGQHQNNVEDDNMDITPSSSPSPVIPGSEMDACRLGIVRMSLSFVFDVLFHLPLNKDVLDNWFKTFEQVFSSSIEITSMFVADLADRTRLVNENWIRAYTMECSEEKPRQTALKIFACAIASLLSKNTELELLERWMEAWKQQVEDRERLIASKRDHTASSFPTKLEATFRPLEDFEKIGVTATSVGIILSYISELIEVSPRYTQAYIDIPFFIRELATSGKSSLELELLRDAMVEARFIERLTCLALRHNSDEQVKETFPGSSVPVDALEAITRKEVRSTNILMNNSEDRSDYATNLILLEAIGCLMGMPWVRKEPIFQETGESNRGRAIRTLTPRAIEALSILYEESKPNGAAGMTLNDIHQYLRDCSMRIPPQRIEQLFERHGVDAEGVDGGKVLDLNGFLVYHRELVNNSDDQVQRELKTFDFRPDLTRRSEKCRWYEVEGEQHLTQYTRIESIANDVAVNYKTLTRLPRLAQTAIESLCFMQFANQNSEFSEYLLAAAACGASVSIAKKLIQSAARWYHRSLNNSWDRRSDNERMVIMIMRVLVAIPDNNSDDRIQTLMLYDESNRDDDMSVGLLRYGYQTARQLSGRRQTYNDQQFLQSITHTIQVLQRQHLVDQWMQMNPRCWAWMNPNQSRREMAPMQARNDQSGRRGHHNQYHDDQDGMESDDDDGFDDSDEYGDTDDIIVEGCGIEAMNGLYKRQGACDNVPKYVNSGRYNGNDEEFTLFRCKLMDDTRRWYISIVPPGANPGTTKDVDFYAAPTNFDDSFDDNLPPMANWIVCMQNAGPAPTGVYPYTYEDEMDDVNQQGNIVEDEQGSYNEHQGYL